MIVRRAFSQLLQPGLAGRFYGLGLAALQDMQWQEQDQMAILHPDTSAIPVWRRRPTRVEHPMTAWRVWGMELTYEDNFYDFEYNFAQGKRGAHEEKINAYLKSVAADCNWDGPVLRSHKRPVDPKYWDSIREKRITDPDEYYAEMRDTFELAGIWAVKTQNAAIDVAHGYGVSTYGRIKIWGRVAEFTQGYRAEVCIIDELWLITRQLVRRFNARNDKRDDELIEARIKAVAKALENRYQCKVNLDTATSPH